MTEAIETDVKVLEETPKDQQEQHRSKRDLDMEALIARRQAEAEPTGQIDDNVDQGGAAEETKDQELEKEEKKQVPMIDLIDDDGNVISVPASAKYRAKIDGNEEDVPVDKMARSYQKGVSADRKLEEAARRKKELDEREAALETKGVELTKKEHDFLSQMRELGTQKDDGDISDDAFKKSAKKLIEALTESEGENIEEAVADVLKGLAAKPQKDVNVDEIAEKARKEVLSAIEKREREKDKAERKKQAEAQEKAVKDANEKFETEYNDIVKDKILYGAAKSMAVEERANDPNATPWEICERVGNAMREYKKNNSPQSKPKKPPATPKSVSARASIGTDEKPITRKDVLSKMRAARGQPA